MKIEWYTEKAQNTQTGSKDSVQIDGILYSTVFLSNDTNPVEMVIYQTDAAGIAAAINDRGPFLVSSSVVQCVGITITTVIGAIVIRRGIEPHFR